MRVRHIEAVLGWLLLCGCHSAGGVPARREYQQTLDSGTNACRHNPAYCAVMPASVRTTAQAGASVAGALKVMDAATQSRLHDILKKCATLADQEVNLRLLDGKTPTAQQCEEQVGTDAAGKPITRAMQLGREKHEVALRCVQEHLSVERPGGFSLEQRYGYDMRTGALRLITRAEAEAWLRSGQAGQLLGTLIPDVVIHLGDPLAPEDAFDFKFPCPISNSASWRRYPRNHPYEGRTQGQMYEQALGIRPWLVVPILGASQ
ncbi:MULTISPECIES: hypothetical protein [unclassified Corallococcus]|uniref:hypothetical protein n=1 Tax=unclassified Corallococcus TaxID=2685029 RepID=UPI001A8F0DE7|nr:MULTISPECIES: hypothetical protein [unclassified Corallococcus]MBN9683732.1 hypothetical protein [Corallococcus sp. NCSPR001]WAS84763.1 hypothetical protein O0N60_36535 [Corallococcus sp. NCRR]